MHAKKTNNSPKGDGIKKAPEGKYADKNRGVRAGTR